MGPVNLLLPIPAIVLTILTTAMIVRYGAAATPQKRFDTLDGLRGVLALMVVIHHSCIGYFYLQTGQWKVPPSRVYTNIGQASLVLFFMITGLLFFSRILQARARAIDWGELYVSRLLRMTPMYFFSMALMFAIVALISKGVLHEPPLSLAGKLLAWLGFTIFGEPDLNGIPHTSLIMAGVTWSVAYEWLFYLSLPLLALTVRATPPLPYLLIGVIGLAGFVLWSDLAQHLRSFLGGIVAALFVRSDRFRLFARGPLASMIVLMFFGITLVAYHSSYRVLTLLLLTASFSLIAGGNTLFGLFTSAIFRKLGEAAYSIYLLHGMLLFTCFHLMIGSEAARNLSPLAYWLVVAAVAPLLVVASTLTFRTIEQPAMRHTRAVTSWLRSVTRTRGPAVSTAASDPQRPG